MIKAESIAVGDKVLIKQPDLYVDQDFGDYFITEEMEKLSGTIQTVTQVMKDNSFYIAGRKVLGYNWTVDMITAVFKSEVCFK